mgnify:CR=1 FL=1
MKKWFVSQIERGLRHLEKNFEKILCKAYRFRPENEMAYERPKTLRVTMARGSDKPHAD